MKEKNKDLEGEDIINTPEEEIINTPVIEQTDNIFKELSGDLDFGKKENTQENNIVKDKEYYLRLTKVILGIINVILFLSIFLGFLYVKAQNNETLYSKSFLDPICFIILGDLSDKNTGEYCSSVLALSTDYDSKINQLRSDIIGKISKISLDLSKIESFVNSGEISFLLNNKLDKLKVLNILNDFDELKNSFSGNDKKLVTCKSIRISGDNMLETTCDIYSSSWEKVDNENKLGIIGDTGDRNTSLLEGTSISVAASFLNFIEKNPEYNFQLMDKQKIFTSEDTLEGIYVKKTSIALKMKYNNLKSNLSL